MEKTLLEWSVANKKAKRNKLLKELLKAPIKWVPDFPIYNSISPDILHGTLNKS